MNVMDDGHSVDCPGRQSISWSPMQPVALRKLLGCPHPTHDTWKILHRWEIVRTYGMDLDAVVSVELRSER